MNNLKEINALNKFYTMPQISHTSKFIIINNKNCMDRLGELDFANIAMQAAKKEKLDLMASLMPYYAIIQMQSGISKIVKLLQGNPMQSLKRDSYDLPEAAIYLGIGKSTLRKALSDKEIIGDRVGRKWRFTQSQLDKYIKRGKSDAEIDSEVEKAILSSKRKHK